MFDSTTDHLMFDFETLSRRPNAALLSVAILKFNFEENGVTVTSAIKTVFDPLSNFPDSHYDPETIAWWLKNVSVTPDIIHSIIPNPDDNRAISIPGGLQENSTIHQWIDNFDLEALGIDHIWCNGPGFDGAILESHLVRMESTQYEGKSKFEHLQFWKMRDLRTLTKMTNVDRGVCERYMDQFIFQGKARKHDPLFDCWSQLGMLTVAMKKLGKITGTDISYKGTTVASTLDSGPNEGL
jgi:hypothetical protein